MVEGWPNHRLSLTDTPPTLQYSIFLPDSFELDLYDAPAFHVDDRELVAVFLDPLAAARDALEPGQHEPRQGVIIGRFVKRQIKVGFQIFQQSGALNDQGAVGQTLYRAALFAVVLVTDFADDLFDQIFERGEPLDFAEFIDHQSHRHPAALQLLQ